MIIAAQVFTAPSDGTGFSTISGPWRETKLLMNRSSSPNMFQVLMNVQNSSAFGRQLLKDAEMW